MQIRKVGVVGAGLMGSGIAQVCAQVGYDATVCEASQELLEGGLGRIRRTLSGAVTKGKLDSAQAAGILARIKGTVKVEDLAESDIVIEAISENLDSKRKLFGTLDGICPAHTLFASNTSSISIIQIATATKRAERFVGLHFFNPVPVMKLVEVVRSIQTGDEAVSTAKAFVESLGKQPIQTKDHPGFVVNLLLVPYLLDAIRAYESGLASKEDIDTGMTLGCGYPMGPLTLLDFVGLDTIHSIANILYDEFKEPRYAPPVLLKQMVQGGYYGKKNGKGFFDYAAK